ncbi:MAG: DUF5787 family protein, partial [Halobacteriaceae archaeon]
DTMRPDCRHFTLQRDGSGYLPYCEELGRKQRASECSSSCPQFEPEPPNWRNLGWPIEGGPGKAIKRILRRRKSRNQGT